MDKIQLAIARLKEFELKDEPYFLAFSGGKDSITIKKLADLAGVHYEAVYNVTTIDPPELVYFMRKVHPDVRFSFPPKAFLTRVPERGFPTRLARWCCEEYKERGGIGRRVVTGIRWEESRRRQQRRVVEPCFKGNYKVFVNPIIDWTEQDVWSFIKQEKLAYCKLYDEGWKRIGCLFCPFTPRTRRKMQVAHYSGYRKAFIRAFVRLHENRKRQRPEVVARWKDGREMFWWWVNEAKQVAKKQLSFSETETRLLYQCRGALEVQTGRETSERETIHSLMEDYLNKVAPEEIEQPVLFE